MIFIVIVILILLSTLLINLKIIKFSKHKTSYEKKVLYYCGVIPIVSLVVLIIAIFDLYTQIWVVSSHIKITVYAIIISGPLVLIFTVISIFLLIREFLLRKKSRT